MEHSHIIQHENALNFILGGNALFTIKSKKTGTRFTFKVLIDQKNEGCFRVQLLTGTDNTRNYTMIGKIDVSKLGVIPLSIHTKSSPAFVAINHVVTNLQVSFPMPSLEIWHEGRCCRCGRVLTVPESIMNGIGPECIFKQDVKNY